jgi:hypothetical protein
MAIMLGTLLKADNAAAVAVFQILRRSSAQRDAISEAAKATINRDDQELLNAILNVHKSTETERNSLAHGVLGVCEEISDGIAWLQADDFVMLRLKFHMEEGFVYDEAEEKRLASKAFIYKGKDLESLLEEIKELWGVWFKLLTYLRYPLASSEERRQLCDQPRIAQELQLIRQKNNPSTPPQ